MVQVKKNWLIIFLTILGGVLRLYRIGPSLQFLGDQGRDALVLMRIFTERDLPFIGPITSVGNFYLGPLYYYLMAPWLWLFNFNPVGPAVATAFIGILTIPAIYLAAAKLFSSRVGLIAAAMYALGSIPVLQTRGAWNPNPMPLVALGIIYSCYQIFIQKQPRWLLGLSLALAIALQLHYIILFLTPFLFWKFIRQPRSIWLNRYFIWSVLIFLIFNFPLLLFEVKNNWLNAKGLFYYFKSSGYEEFSWLQKIKDITGRSEAVLGMVLGFGEQYSPVRAGVTKFIGSGILLYLFLKKDAAARLIGQYLFISILALVFYRGNVFPHYLGFLYPAVFILTALLMAQFKRFYLIFPAIFLAWFCLLNLKTLIKPIFYSNGNLASSELTANRIAEDIDKHHYADFNLVLIDETHDYRAMGFRYFLELKGNKALEVDDYANADAVYVISPYRQVDVVNIPIWEIHSTWPARETEKWEYDDSENIYKIEQL